MLRKSLACFVLSALMAVTAMAGQASAASPQTWLPGIDVSYANGPSRTVGLNFAIIRATYGVAVDSRYASHVREFDASIDADFASHHPHDFVTGAYAFGVGNWSGKLQAQIFLRVASGQQILVLDLEGNGPHGISMTNAQAREFILTVHQAGRKIWLYASEGRPYPDLGQDGRWIAHYGIPGAKYGSLGHTSGPRLRWDVWQWQGSPMDRNWFRGTFKQLLALGGPCMGASAHAKRIDVLNDAINLKLARLHYAQVNHLTSRYASLERQLKTLRSLRAAVPPLCRATP